MDCRPYQGPDVYPIDTVLYMLDQGICDSEDVKWGLRPTRRVPAVTLRNAARDVEEVLAARFPSGDFGETTASTCRAMFLGAIGSWTQQRSYRLTQCASDLDHAAEAAFQLGAKPTRVRRGYNEGQCTSMRYVEMMSHRSLLPCALLALHLEQLHVLNLEALSKLRNMNPIGAIVDCLYF